MSKGESAVQRIQKMQMDNAYEFAKLLADARAASAKATGETA